MTSRQSAARLVLYVTISMLTASSVGLSSIDFGNPRQVAGYTIGILAAGLVTVRSYIDQSSSQVAP